MAKSTKSKTTKKNKYTFAHFDFFVEGISEVQASDLYDIMLIYCRNHGVAGSFDMLTNKDMDELEKNQGASESSTERG